MADISSFLEDISSRRVLLLGDIMVDWYTYGTASRISPEAPIPVLHKTGEKFVLGGAGNVAYNIAALGARVTLAGVVGNDPYKETVFSLVRKYGMGACILVHKTKPTIIKHRLVAGNQQLLRLDEEDQTFLEDAVAEELCARFLPFHILPA